jgi:hypothetical protein
VEEEEFRRKEAESIERCRVEVDRVKVEVEWKKQSRETINVTVRTHLEMG